MGRLRRGMIEKEVDHINQASKWGAVPGDHANQVHPA